MTKIIECKNTKAELEGYIECCIDQLRMISRKYIGTNYKAGNYLLKAEYYFIKIMEHTSSPKIIATASSYYKKIIYHYTLLVNGIYKEDEDNG